MKTVIRIFYGIFFFCLIAGVLAVLPLDMPGMSVYIVDIVVVLSLPITFYLSRIHRWEKEERSIATYGIFFLIVGVIGLFFSPVSMNPGQRWIAALYLVRWVAYAAIYFLTRYVIDKGFLSAAIITEGVKIISLTIAGLGWLQYILYPNLRNLEYLGWDPHVERIFSTYLDPNYFGLIMVLALILWGVPLLQGKRDRPITEWTIVGFLLVTLLFTYSRSSYLTFMAVVLGYSVLRRRWQVIGAVIGLFLLAILVMPQPSGEGGKLWRVYTLFSRAQSWEQGMRVFTAHPIIGVGFNTLRYAKTDMYPSGDVATNHAGAGIDNSLIFLAATTGVLGLVTYLLFLSGHIAATHLIGQLSMIAVLIHSLFQNSLFYAWVMLWLWIVVAVDRKMKR